MPTLRRRDLAQAFARSLALQASWSFEGMQSVGFAFSMEPILRRLYDGEALREARARHLEFFNTHPFLAAAVLGCAARLESEGGADAGERVRHVKKALMGPYGAIGDTFCWGALKPVLLVLALHLAVRGSLWAPWVFLALWTGITLSGRVYLFVQGYRRGTGVVAAVEALSLLEASRTMKAVTAILLGALLASVAGAGPVGLTFAAPPVAWTASVGLITFGLIWLIQRGANPVWFAYLAAALAAGVFAWT